MSTTLTNLGSAMPGVLSRLLAFRSRPALPPAGWPRPGAVHSTARRAEAASPSRRMVGRSAAAAPAPGGGPPRGPRGLTRTLPRALSRFAVVPVPNRPGRLWIDRLDPKPPRIDRGNEDEASYRSEQPLEVDGGFGESRRIEV